MTIYKETPNVDIVSVDGVSHCKPSIFNHLTAACWYTIELLDGNAIWELGRFHSFQNNRAIVFTLDGCVYTVDNTRIRFCKERPE